MLIADFLNEFVYPDVVGCSAADMTLAVRRAATEFFIETGAWNEIQDPVPLVARTNEYGLDAPTGALVIDVRDVYATWMVNGRLIPTTIAQLAYEMPNWASAEADRASRYTRAFDFTSIRVYPLPTAPTSSDVMRIHAVYSLKRSATTIPDDIVERWGEVIASGAKSRLMVMPRVKWFEPKLAVYHGDLFASAKLAAKVNAEMSKTRGVVTAAPRAFGRS